MLTPADLAAIRAVIRAEISAAAVPRRAAPVDLALLLRAVAESLGSDEFTARQLCRHPHVGPLLAGHSPKSVGRVLAHAVDRPVGGLVVRAWGTERSVRLFAVERADE